MKTSGIKQKKDVRVSQSTILCSTPINKHSVFKKAIVLITRYNSYGTTGIILNSPLDSIVHLNDVHNLRNEIPLNYGGPDDNLLSFLVSIPSLPDGIRTSTYWSRNSKDLMLLMKLINAEEVLINSYKGSMQWFPGDLEEEITNGMWWATDDYCIDQIFENRNEIYMKIAKQVSGHYAPLLEADIPIIYN